MEKISVSKRKKVLFVGEHITPSHVMRPFILAKWLESQNLEYDIEFAGTSFPADAKSKIIYHKLPSPDKETLERRVRKVIFPLYKKHEIKTMVDAEIRLIKLVKPDLIVHDFRNTLAISTQVTKTPLISLNDFYWNKSYVDVGLVPDTPLSRFVGNKFARKMGRVVAPVVEKYHVSQFNSVARSFGVKGFEYLRDLYNAGESQWLFDIPEVFPDKNKAEFVGPLLWESSDSLPEWISDIKDGSAICITLTSSGNQKLIKKIIEAVLPLNIPIIVLTAGKYKMVERAGVYVVDFASMSGILKKTRLFISTGGSSVVYHSLRSGVPIIGIPQNITHWLSMYRFSKMGIGTLVPPEEVNDTSFRPLVLSILEDDSYLARTQKYRDSLNEYDTKNLVKFFLDQEFLEK